MNSSALGNAPTTAPIVKKVTTFIPKSPKQMSKVQRRLAHGRVLQAEAHRDVHR